MLINILNLFFLCFILCLFSGCLSNKEIHSDRKFVGFWPNINQPDLGIEFDKNGSYYLLYCNKRLEIENSTVLSYCFILEATINFNLTEDSICFTYDGTLTFVNEAKINLSLNVSECLIIDGLYVSIMDYNSSF